MLRPADELSLYIDAHKRLHVRTRHEELAPMPLGYPDDLPDQIYKQVAQLETLATQGAALEAVCERIETQIGRMLGGLLFDRSDLWVPDADASEARANALDGVLGALSRSLVVGTSTDPNGAYVRILLATESAILQELPWELLVWPTGDGDVYLATDERFTLTRLHRRRSLALGGCPPRHKLRMLHVTSNAQQGAAQTFAHEHDQLIERLQALSSRSGGHLEPRVEHAESLMAALEALPADHTFDVIEFLGHSISRRDRSLVDWAIAAEPGGEASESRAIGTRLLLHLTRGRVRPALFSLISCYGNGFAYGSDDGGAHAEGPSLAETLLREGCPAVLAMTGAFYVARAERLVDSLGRALIDGEPLDRVVQRARAELWAYELTAPRLPSGEAIPKNWYRPALTVRSAEALEPIAGPAPPVPVEPTEAPVPGEQGVEPEPEVGRGSRRGWWIGGLLLVAMVVIGSWMLWHDGSKPAVAPAVIPAADARVVAMVSPVADAERPPAPLDASRPEPPVKLAKPTRPSTRRATISKRVETPGRCYFWQHATRTPPMPKQPPGAKCAKTQRPDARQQGRMQQARQSGARCRKENTWWCIQP